MVVCDSRALALECTETMTPSYQSTSSSQADIPNSNYSTGPTDPDQNTYSQTQWASLLTHKGKSLWTLLMPLSPLCSWSNLFINLNWCIRGVLRHRMFSH